MDFLDERNGGGRSGATAVLQRYMAVAFLRYSFLRARQRGWGEGNGGDLVAAEVGGRLGFA
jgi:hypothetical protein